MDYPSNPGVGETVIILGLKGQYIMFAAIAIVFFIVLAAILGSTDIPILLVVLILVISVTVVLGGIIKINKQYGRNGLMKVFVMMKTPKYVRNTEEMYHIIKRNKDA